MFPTRVLIIEDDHENLALMSLIFERANFEVFKAVDGISGLEIARQEQPDIILLDLAIPNLDGWEVTRRIKENIITKNIPIIIVTALALSRDKKRAFEAGCDAYFVKPFNVTELMSEVGKLVDR